MGGRLREWMLRLTSLARPGRSDDDLEAELRTHLAFAADETEAATDEGTARAAVMRAGGVDQAMEALRDQRGVPLVADLGRDISQAARLFTRTPGVAVVAVLSLTLSLALVLTVFRVVNAYVLRGFPYPDADRLYSVILNEPGRPFLRGTNALDWGSLGDVVEHHISWDLDMFYLLGGEHPEAVPSAWVTPGFVDGLGVRVALGRTFQPGDFAPAGPSPVLISHRLWTSRFGGDRSIVGRSLTAYFSDRPEETETLTVAGVLPADFWHVNTYTDIIAPLRAPQLPYMATLREGVDPTVAAARIDALVRGTLADVPEGWHARLEPAHDRYIASVTPLLSAVTAASVLVVLIACANVAVLLLVRAVGRRHEMAVRLALGASRFRLARLLAVEALMIGAVATALAIVTSSAVLGPIAAAVEMHVSRRLPGGADALAVDGTHMMFTVGAMAVVTLVLALVPLAGVSLPSLRTGLVSSGRTDTAGPAAGRARSALVAAEVAGALALLVGAALMVDSTLRLVQEDIGIRTNVMSASVALRRPSYPEPADRARFFQRLLQLLGDRTGGASVAIGATWPLQPAQARTITAPDDNRATLQAAVTPVSAGYFDTLGIPLREGRTFHEEDRPGGVPVAVVSESLARRLWPDGRAVGRDVLVPVDDAVAPAATPETRYRIVGVAADVRHLVSDGPTVATDRDLLELYVPLLQRPGHFAFLYLPARADIVSGEGSTALKNGVAALDSEATVFEPRLLAADIDDVRARPRRLAWLLSTLALFASLLALIGVYGVVSYAVRQREREIGIRMAIGADATDVTRLFVREGRWLLAAGISAGLLGALALGRVLESQLFGVSAVSPRLLGLVAASLGVSAALAIWWPARRAAGVDPSRVLRE